MIIGLVSVQLALDCQLELSLAKFHLGEGDLFRQRAASIYGLVCSFDLSRGGVTIKNDKIWDNVPIMVDPSPPPTFGTFLKNVDPPL